MTQVYEIKFYDMGSSYALWRCFTFAKIKAKSLFHGLDPINVTFPCIFLPADTDYSTPPFHHWESQLRLHLYR